MSSKYISPMGGGKNRILYLDTAKVIAMFLVVFAHLFSTYSQTRLFIYAFHMPFFFLISGVFHKGNRKINIIDPFWKLLVPCAFYSLVYILLCPLFEAVINRINITNYINEVCFLIKKTVVALKSSGDMANVPCWFLISLYTCRVCMDAILKLNKIYLQVIVLMSILAIAMRFHLPLFGNSTAMILPFYYAGYMLHDKLMSLKYKKQYNYIIVVTCVLSVGMSLLNNRVSVHGFMFGSLPYHLNVLVFYINASMGSMALLLLSLIISLKHCEWISVLATALLPIVGLQWLFINPYQEFTEFRYDLIIPAVYSAFIIVVICFISKFLLSKVPRLSGYKI